MLGYGVGDEFEWTVPYGSRRLKVLKVRCQPEASAKNAGVRSEFNCAALDERVFHPASVSLSVRIRLLCAVASHHDF